MTAPLYVFVSSKMRELAAERQALRELIPALSNDVVTLQAWVFEEDAPATDRSIRQVYLDALKRSVAVHRPVLERAGRMDAGRVRAGDGMGH
ncbi:MAG: hypothetical protein KatS3mg051_0412 [Anaerolineae bacterium]|nr:MAG: hypothetical protein KatS3mg051_0412 [Anaerolineae bacterium]